MHDDQDRLLDHSYDGIQEYDNPLPGWWVWLFWATILVSLGYPLYYHVGIGELVYEQYNNSAAAFFEAQAKELEGMEITEELLASFQEQTALMGGMEQVFVSKCATCHAAAGQGDACPNLTDDYWINGGSLLEIHETIRDGVSGKEMKSWLSELGPARVLHMTAYVGTLRGKNVPGGKKPEGKLYTPPPPGESPKSEEEATTEPKKPQGAAGQ